MKISKRRIQQIVKEEYTRAVKRSSRSKSNAVSRAELRRLIESMYDSSLEGVAHFSIEDAVRDADPDDDHLIHDKTTGDLHHYDAMTGKLTQVGHHPGTLSTDAANEHAGTYMLPLKHYSDGQLLDHGFGLDHEGMMTDPESAGEDLDRDYAHDHMDPEFHEDLDYKRPVDMLMGREVHGDTGPLETHFDSRSANQRQADEDADADALRAEEETKKAEEEYKQNLKDRLTPAQQRAFLEAKGTDLVPMGSLAALSVLLGSSIMKDPNKSAEEYEQDIRGALVQNQISMNPINVDNPSEDLLDLLDQGYVTYEQTMGQENSIYLPDPKQLAMAIVNGRYTDSEALTLKRELGAHENETLGDLLGIPRNYGTSTYMDKGEPVNMYNPNIEYR